MHIDFIREEFYKLINPKFVERATDLYILKCFAIDDFVDHAEDVGDEKIRSIAQTMKNSKGYRHVNSRKRITEKQRYAIAQFLLNKYGTAKSAIAHVFKVDENKIDLTENELANI